MKARNVSLAIAAPLALIASLVVAQDDPASILEALDADGNGSLSESEAAANEMILSKWEKLDVDGNAEISAEELAALAK
jgi:hypothetical protein